MKEEGSTRERRRTGGKHSLHSCTKGYNWRERKRNQENTKLIKQKITNKGNKANEKRV